MTRRVYAVSRLQQMLTFGVTVCRKIHTYLCFYTRDATFLLNAECFYAPRPTHTVRGVHLSSLPRVILTVQRTRALAPVCTMILTHVWE